MKKTHRTILWTLFIVYAVVMLYLLFGQRIGRSSYLTYTELLRANLNLIPFKTITSFITVVRQGLQGGNTTFLRFAVINLLGNVLVFVPLGLFLLCLWPKLRSFPRFLITVAVIIFFIELTQLFTLLGSCDIDDLILNILGAAMGYWLYRIIERIFQKKVVSQEKPSAKKDKS